MDFGCGTGRYLEIFQKFKVVYLVDVSKHNLKIASEKAQIVQTKKTCLSDNPCRITNAF